MDMCSESLSSLWIAFLRAIGFCRINHQRDALWSAEDMIGKSIAKIETKIQAVRAVIGKTADTARLAHSAGNRAGARSQILRLRRMQGQERQLLNLHDSLEAQRDAIGCTELNETMLHALKGSTQALAQLQKHSQVQDVSHVDFIRQELDDQLRTAHEITESVSTPLGYAIDDYSLDDDALDAAIMDLVSVDEAPTHVVRDRSTEGVAADTVPKIPQCTLEVLGEPEAAQLVLASE